MKQLLPALCITLVLLGCKQPPKPRIKPAFTKIVFNTGMCFGTCPVYHLQVDSDKVISLYAEKVFVKYNETTIVPSRSFGIDAAKTGYFKGIVSDSAFAQLNKALTNTPIETLKLDTVNCCDGSFKTIIIYYNGKRKVLKTMFAPHEMEGLIKVLYQICNQSGLKRVTEKFTIEDVNDLKLSDIHYPRAIK